MIEFYHNGHLGDIVYSLYTTKSCLTKGYPGNYYLDIYQEESPGWTKQSVESITRLCESQNLKVYQTERYCPPGAFNFDIARREYTPDSFYEWHGKSWPGNCHLKKRYFVPYWKTIGIYMSGILKMLEYNRPWIDIDVGTFPKVYDVIAHLPSHKLVHSHGQWIEILTKIADKGYQIALIGSCDNDFPEGKWDKFMPEDLYQAAQYIKAAKLFIGVASSPYVIAEALNQFRLVDLYPQAECAEPYSETGWNVATWDVRKIELVALELLKR